MNTTFAAPSSQRRRASGAARPRRSLVAKLRRAWSDYKTYRHTVRELRRLTPELREDLGLDLLPVDGIARRAVYGA